MKIWASAKGSDGNGTLEDGRLKFFFVWQVLKMTRENLSELCALTVFSAHSPADCLGEWAGGGTVWLPG